MEAEGETTTQEIRRAWLAELEAAREIDPDRAYAMVLENPERLDVSDPDWVGWIGDRSVPEVPAALRPLFLRGLEQPGAVRRICAHRLGVSAFYCGDLEEAERLWRLGVQLGREQRDKRWLSSLVNLAQLARYRGQHFECLVLSGVVLRELREEPDHPVAAFGARERIAALIDLGELEAARALLSSFRPQDIGAGEPGSRAERGRFALLCTEVDLAMAEGRWEEVERLCELRAGTRRGSTTPDAVLLYEKAQRLRARFERDPAQGEMVLRELNLLVEEHPVQNDWKENWIATLSLLGWSGALARGDHGDAEAFAREAFARMDPRTNGLLSRQALALLERHSACSLIRAQLEDQAVDLLLERLANSQLELELLPELERPTPEDRRHLAAHHRRLLDVPSGLRAAFARRWRPGTPAYDALARSGLVIVCAWCGRARDRDHGWISPGALPQLLDSDAFSHGICEDCVQLSLA